MYKYRIIKKGRKWFEAIESEKGYKAKIEINYISNGGNKSKQLSLRQNLK